MNVRIIDPGSRNAFFEMKNLPRLGDEISFGRTEEPVRVIHVLWVLETDGVIEPVLMIDGALPEGWPDRVDGLSGFTDLTGGPLLSGMPEPQPEPQPDLGPPKRWEIWSWDADSLGPIRHGVVMAPNFEQACAALANVRSDFRDGLDSEHMTWRGCPLSPTGKVKMP